MAKFVLKRAPNAKKIKMLIPDGLYEQLTEIAQRANCSLDEVVSLALKFSLRSFHIDGESTGLGTSAQEHLNTGQLKASRELSR